MPKKKESYDETIAHCRNAEELLAVHILSIIGILTPFGLVVLADIAIAGAGFRCSDRQG